MKTKLEVEKRYKIDGTNKSFEFVFTTEENIEEYKNWLLCEADYKDYEVFKAPLELYGIFKGEFTLYNAIGYNLYIVLTEEYEEEEEEDNFDFMEIIPQVYSKELEESYKRITNILTKNNKEA